MSLRTPHVHRLISPRQPEGTVILVVALVGILVNLAATWQLSQANRESMNVEGSFQHILTDLLAFIFTAIAAVVILTTGFVRADAIASLIVAAIMVRAAYGLLRDSGRVLLEAAPKGMSVTEIGKALAHYPGVTDVHDLHVWTITSGFPSLSAHVLVRAGDDCHAIRRQLEGLLAARFQIDHTTLQVDHQPSGCCASENDRRATLTSHNRLMPTSGRLRSPREAQSLARLLVPGPARAPNAFWRGSGSLVV